MFLNQKKFRYFYWIILEFVRKHLRLILLSFFISILTIVSVISFSPYLINSVTSQKTIIGIVGNYTLQDLPESVLSKISSGLVFINDRGETIPVIAESWTHSKDGKTYAFKLRKDLQWNDGKPFTADGISYRFKDVQVKKKSDYEVEFSLAKPLAIFPTYLTIPIVKDPFIGVAGIYKVDRSKIIQGNVKELYLTPNKSNLPLLVYKFYDNETKMIEAYKLGEVTEMVITKQSVIDTFASWKNTEIEKSVDYGRLMTLFFSFNNEFLKEKDNRKAIANAISRDMFGELGVEASGPVPPLSWAYNGNVKKPIYDPDLAESVLKKNFDATGSAALNLDTYFEYLDVGEQIKTSLEKVGLKVNLNTVSFSKTAPFDMLLAYWKVPLDPDQYYFWHSTQKQGNIINYNNPKIDLLLEDGRGSTSVSERRRIYFEFQRILVDDTPAYFFFYPYVYTVRRK